MQAVVAKLSAKLAQYPLLADLKMLGKKKWMRERVTSTETALFAAGDGAGGSYRRRRGDIYSVME
jgi:hypothetical protein